jgi:hypothetical protein
MEALKEKKEKKKKNFDLYCYNISPIKKYDIICLYVDMFVYATIELFSIKLLVLQEELQLLANPELVSIMS